MVGKNVEKKKKAALDIVPKGNIKEELAKGQGGALSEVPKGNVREEIELADKKNDRLPRITEREPTFGKKAWDTAKDIAEPFKDVEGVQTGTLPISIGGAGTVAKVAKKVPDIMDDVIGGLTKSPRKIAKIAEKVRRQRVIDDIARTLGVTQKRAGAIAAIIAKTPKETLLNALSAKPVKLAGKIIAGVSGVDILTTWFASDNIISATPFHLKEIRNGVASGDIDAAQAEELISEAEATFETAKGFVNTSTRYNPALWPFRNIFMVGANAKKTEMDLIIDNIRFSSEPEQIELRETQREASNIRNEDVIKKRALEEKKQAFAEAKAPVGSEQ